MKYPALSFFYFAVGIFVPVESGWTRPAQRPIYASHIPDKFDLRCYIRGNKYFQRHPEREGSLSDLSPWRWNFGFRYSIDLKKKIYWDLEWKNLTPSPILAVKGRRLIFYNDDERYNRIDLDTGKFVEWGVSDYSRSYVSRGHCKMAPYSGDLRLNNRRKRTG